MKKGPANEGHEEIDFQDDFAEVLGVKQETKRRNLLASESKYSPNSAQLTKSSRKLRSKRKARQSTGQEPKNAFFEVVGGEANENYEADQKSMHLGSTELRECSENFAIHINLETAQGLGKCYAKFPNVENQSVAVDKPEMEDEQELESCSEPLSDSMPQPESKSVDLSSDCTEITICLIKLAHKFNPHLATCLERCIIDFSNDTPIVPPEPKSMVDLSVELNSESPIDLTEESEDSAQDHSEIPPPDKQYFSCDDYRRCLLKLVKKVQPEMFSYVQQCAALLNQYESETVTSIFWPPSLSAIPLKSSLKPCLRKMIRIFDPELNKCIEGCGL